MGIKEYFYNLFEQSGVKDDLIYINENTPKNGYIFCFLLFLPLSFMSFFIIIFNGYIYFLYLSFVYFINKYVKKQDYILKCNQINNNKSTFLYLLKEFLIAYPKCKSYLIFYNLIKIFNFQFNQNKKSFKFKLFSYFFKKLFYALTLIPFVIFKINCIIYKGFKNILK